MSDWRKRANCRGLPTSWWFQEGVVDSDDIYRIRKVKHLCSTCPVRLPCLDDGMDEEFGIWGGMGPRARWELQRGSA